LSYAGSVLEYTGMAFTVTPRKKKILEITVVVLAAVALLGGTFWFGWAAGRQLAGYIGAYDHWLALLLLGGTAGPAAPLDNRST